MAGSLFPSFSTKFHGFERWLNAPSFPTDSPGRSLGSNKPASNSELRLTGDVGGKEQEVVSFDCGFLLTSHKNCKRKKLRNHIAHSYKGKLRTDIVHLHNASDYSLSCRGQWQRIEPISILLMSFPFIPQTLLICFQNRDLSYQTFAPQ